MKRLMFFLAVFGLFALNAYGQKKLPDFSSDWVLDLKASDLVLSPKGIQRMNLSVVQTETQITVGYISSTSAEPMPGVPFKPVVYNTFSLDGKETTTESAFAGVGPSKLTAKTEKSKLVMTIKREVTTPRGPATSVTIETFELSSDGGTLKVTREIGTTGTMPVEKMVFHKAPAAG